jgi:hypothetical protein
MITTYFFKDSDLEEELFGIAHFLLRHASWDPYKQSFLAISLMEKSGDEAMDMWDKILTPLEKAYENSSGVSFKDKFGFDYRTEEEEEEEGATTTKTTKTNLVAATRSHALKILTVLSKLMKEAGQLQDTPQEAKKKGVLTPLERAEREAKRKVPFVFFSLDIVSINNINNIVSPLLCIVLLSSVL